jgi:hypothetical protein
MYYMSQTNKYKQGDSCREYGQIPEMIPGERYTVSVWARVISGDGALIRFSWGGTHNNTPFNQEGKCVVSDPIEVKGSAWARYSWTFTFTPQGDWYTETSEDVEGVTWITRNYNWNKRVAFGVLRKWNSVIQLTGFRLVAGRMWVTDTWDDIGDKIDQYTGRIDDLDTEVAKKADKAKTELTGPVSMGRKTGSPAGVRSLAMGDDAVAGGKGSAAQGIGVVTYTDGGRAFGSYNAMPTRNVADYDVGHAYAVGNYVRYEEDMIDPDTDQIIPEGSIVEIYRCLVAHTSVEDWPESDKWQRVARFTLAEYSGNSVPADLLEAVGNGTGDGARSNARTLDRDGNETLAGKLTLGAAPAGDMDAATKAYVDGAGKGIILLNLQNIDLSLGQYQVNPPFQAQEYRVRKITISSKHGLTALKVITGITRDTPYIYFRATVTMPDYTSYMYRNITLELEKIEASYDYSYNTGWTEKALTGFETDLEI